MSAPAETPGDRLPAILRRALGPHWDITVADTRIKIQHSRRCTSYRPPRRTPSWAELFAMVEDGFAAQGVPRDACLPLRWGRETELTISAIQALDPLLKDGQLRTHRQGFLPQPVVRLTGRRDRRGDLHDGFLTSFVNVSNVQPIQHVEEYGSILDGCLSVLSHLGFHARHLSFHGDLATWQRRQVSGVTLHFHHLDLPLGDIVLLWNTQNPRCMAVDFGTGLERLAWARSRRPWHDLIHGQLARSAPPSALDALRTATLLLGQGIRPTPRGAGSVTRRVLGMVTPGAAALGVSAVVRAAHGFWELPGPLPVPWPAVAVGIEDGLGLGPTA